MTVGRALDVGSGSMVLFGDERRRDVIHMDLDLYAIPNFIQADAQHLPIRSKCMDTVVLGEVLEHVADDITVLAEATRVARKRIVFSTPNEHLWPAEYSPFITREERRILEEEPDIPTMAYDLVGIDPLCRGIFDETKHPHLWHTRWYDQVALEASLKSTGWSYQVRTMSFNGWAFFLGVLEPPRGSVGEKLRSNGWS